MLVEIRHPNGQTQDVLLAGVPRTGEFVRLDEGAGKSPMLVVEGVLWSEGVTDPPKPTVTIVVRPHVPGPG